MPRGKRHDDPYGGRPIEKDPQEAPAVEARSCSCGNCVVCDLGAMDARLQAMALVVKVAPQASGAGLADVLRKVDYVRLALDELESQTRHRIANPNAPALETN